MVTWFNSARKRAPPTTALEKASRIIASMRTAPRPELLVVKSPIYWTAPKGGVAAAGRSVRNTTKSVLGGKPSAFTCKVSTPRVSLFGKTVIFAWAFGRQEAIAAEAGTRSKLKGAWPYA